MGDHVYVQRVGYTHHGVEVADGMVIHFTGTPSNKLGATIRRETLAVFKGSGMVEVRRYDTRLEPAVVVERAESKLGQSGYNLYANNCEHFARWCVTGDHKSSQSNAVTATGGVAAATAAAGAAGAGVIAAVGEVAGVSAAGIMSGLGTAGSVVGAGAVGGLVVLGAAPAAVSVAVMNLALRDDVALPAEERSARKVGRRASVAGAASASAAGVAAVSAYGTVAGLSAAGISSGLAAIGGVVGGGMLAGSAVVIAAPAVGAAAVGYGAYRVIRRVRPTSAERPLSGTGSTTGTPTDNALASNGDQERSDSLPLMVRAPAGLEAIIAARRAIAARILSTGARGRITRDDLIVERTEQAMSEELPT